MCEKAADRKLPGEINLSKLQMHTPGFSFGTKCSARTQKRRLDNTVNVLSATELNTLKWFTLREFSFGDNKQRSGVGMDAAFFACRICTPLPSERQTSHPENAVNKRRADTFILLCCL